MTPRNQSDCCLFTTFSGQCRTLNPHPNVPIYQLEEIPVPPKCIPLSLENEKFLSPHPYLTRKPRISYFMTSRNCYFQGGLWWFEIAAVTSLCVTHWVCNGVLSCTWLTYGGQCPQIDLKDGYNCKPSTPYIWGENSTTVFAVLCYCFRTDSKIIFSKSVMKFLKSGPLSYPWKSNYMG